MHEEDDFQESKGVEPQLPHCDMACYNALLQRMFELRHSVHKVELQSPPTVIVCGMCVLPGRWKTLTGDMTYVIIIPSMERRLIYTHRNVSRRNTEPYKNYGEEG